MKNIKKQNTEEVLKMIFLMDLEKWNTKVEILSKEYFNLGNDPNLDYRYNQME